MPSKNIKTRTEVLQKFNLTQSDIVRVFNDDECALDGLADNNETFRLFIIKKNGTEILLGDMPPDAVFSIRFRSITFKPETDSYSYIDIDTTSANPPIKARGGVVVGGNKTIIKCIYNPRTNGGVIIDGTSPMAGYEVGSGGAIISGQAGVSIKQSQKHTNQTPGSLYTWGNNYYGQLGNGTQSVAEYSGPNLNPNVVGNRTDWLEVYGKNGTFLATNSSGELYMWGNNNAGQKGDGTFGGVVTTPTKVGNNNNWKKVFITGGACFAINSNGELYSWGSNIQGLLGNGHDSSNIVNPGPARLVPTKIELPHDCIDINTNTTGIMVLLANGELYAWGCPGSLGFGDGVECPSDSQQKYLPRKILNNKYWKAITYSGALSTDDSFWSWGYNDYGSRGDSIIGSGSYGYNWEYEANQKLNGTKYLKAVRVGQASLYLKPTSGQWVAMGMNRTYGTLDYSNALTGVLGIGTQNTPITSPITLDLEEQIESIEACDGFTTIGISISGNVYAWGNNYYGSFGNGTSIPSDSPTEISALRGAVRVALSNGAGAAIIPTFRHSEIGSGGAIISGQAGVAIVSGGSVVNCSDFLLNMTMDGIDGSSSFTDLSPNNSYLPQMPTGATAKTSLETNKGWNFT